MEIEREEKRKEETQLAVLKSFLALILFFKNIYFYQQYINNFWGKWQGRIFQGLSLFGNLFLIPLAFDPYNVNPKS